MVRKNILFIVEGEATEVTFLKRIAKKIPGYAYLIYSYKTCIYELYEELILDEYLDILLTLREKSKKNRKNLFDKNYTDIYLVFDFDPQYHKFAPEKIKKMLMFFNDSTDKGKLFLNYPMMESYRHLRDMPDSDFFDLEVAVNDLGDYKKNVHNFTSYCNTNAYNYDIIIQFLKHHIIKYLILLNLVKDKFALKDFYLYIHSKNDMKLLEYQIRLLKEQGKIKVINTSLFFLLDILPKRFYSSKQGNINFKHFTNKGQI